MEEAQGPPAKAKVSLEICTDFEEEEPSMYGAQLKPRPGKKIELIIEPMDQQ